MTHKYVYSTDDDLDPNVTAIAQTKTIPKVSYTWGLVLLGIGAIAVAWKL
ncbi:MAG: hypothetical protein QNJ51_05120 [Calothrix sp. MO_167.B12]|nr:hypothetical protein [Calothrix sp. MO_167.B12]